ncbi:AcrR family transcriptional regulator [Marmoricola sp. OAE513]|uniref:TetR family transcriptional regulator n=1 Tax=Marmoricola sp. OAE513 TaxID=2817894 RepID=UPI001AE40EF0
MPRIAEGRPPAVPTTVQQQERCDRALAAAARLGAAHGLEHVQMAQVAAEADLALGTLYRYYPSKHHLFAGVLARNVQALRPAARRPGARPAEAVAAFMASACRSMLRSPRLARAMINSVNVVRSTTAVAPDTTMRDRILTVAGITDPDESDLRLARLVEQCAYGVLTWAVAGESTAAEAEADLRRACLLLCAPWGPVVEPAETS